MESRRIAFAGWDAREGRASDMEIDLDHVGQRLAALRGEAKARNVEVQPKYRAPPPARDPKDPAVGKWAIVTLREDAEKAREALAPLLQRRESQGFLWRPPEGAPGVIEIARPPKPSVDLWVKRLRQVTGFEPPHYLLFIGGPDRVPFEVQHAVDMVFATGRLDVSDTPDGPFSWEACRAYAEKVVRYEERAMKVEPRALLYSFSTDEATRDAHENLSMPLAAHLGESRVSRLFGAEATTARLCEALRKSSPAVVITTSHGIEFPAEQGLWGALTDSSFGASASPVPFSAGEVAKGERMGAGAIVLAFACFSAGVPAVSAHRKLVDEVDGVIPGAPFTAALPRAWLGRPDGPVAFAGHVDRATSNSYQAAMQGPNAAPFFDFADWLLGSQGTLGQALSTFHDRAAQAAADLASVLSVARSGAAKRTPRMVADAWVRFHDYEGYVLLGDPAIRAAV